MQNIDKNWPSLIITRERNYDGNEWINMRILATRILQCPSFLEKRNISAS